MEEETKQGFFPTVINNQRDENHKNQELIEILAVTEVAVKTLYHFFPNWRKWLAELPDHRDQESITYPRGALIMAVILMFWMRLSSRRQWTYESRSQTFIENLNRIMGCNLKKLPHDNTFVYYLEKVPPENFQVLPHKMVRELIRKKRLDHFRLYGYFLVAIDGTGMLVFPTRHCNHCLVKKNKDGKVIYYHNVLEAKIVCHNGLAISIATEFIENEDTSVKKQDCELKAFYRLSKKIKKAFPQLPICLLLDGLFACAPVFDICENFRWKYIITFKEGSMPATWQEFMALKRLSHTNRTTHNPDKNNIQTLQWVEGLPYQKYTLNVIECKEHHIPSDKTKTFVWITNFDVGCKSVITLANKGGRLRWKIENEGFNSQKNDGYGLEHAYSKNPQLIKSFYLLLQVAHLLHQLMVKGSLLNKLKSSLGSIKNFIRRLCDGFRYALIPLEVIELSLRHSFQIRLNTS